MHPLSHRWRIAAAVIPVILLAACGRDATPVSPDQSQRSARDILADGPLAYNVIGELELQVGQQSQLKTRNSRNVRGATWTSSNPAVASVNTNGVVAGVATGESFVTLSGFGVSETYRVGVTPTPTVTDLSISPATGTALAPGQSRQFTRSVTWSDGATRAATVTYSVSNAGAGTINSNGLFTAGQLAGTFSIIASCACGGVTPVADTAQVVIASLSSLAISPKTVTVAPGGTQAFSASALWSNGATLLPGVTYSTPSSAEGTVTSPGGLYTAPTTPGTYRVILAQVGGPARDTAIVTVPAPQLTALTISPETVSLAAGATRQFTASANWSTGATTLPPVTWSVIGGGTVSQTGLFTAPGTAGTYRVVVAHNGGTLRDTATVTVTTAPPTLTSLTISPDAVILSPGATRQFSTSAVWSNGTTTTPPLNYTTNGGSVTTAGLYTAPTAAGTYRVIVWHVGGSRSDTATVTVTSTTSTSGGTLTSLSISPKTTALNTGGTRQFSVSASWSNGSTATPSVNYTTNGGSVSAAGLYTAPSTAGTYRVIAWHVGGTRSDTALVTVTLPVAPPSNSPLIWSDSFDNGERNNGNGFVWRDAASVTVSNERAFSGTHALRFRYRPVPSGTDAWSEQRFDLGQYLGELWIEYMLYVPANFRHRADSPGNNKFLWLWKDVYSASGEWNIGWEYLRLTDTTSSGRFISSRWDYNFASNSGPWVTPNQNTTPGLFGGSNPIRPGQWNRIRFHAKAASSRTAQDGESRLWVNNTLVFQITNGRFHNFDAAKTEATLRNGYLLGWSNSGFLEETIFFIDDTKFYRGNPGW